VHARIWYEPDGSVKVTTFIDGADPGMVAQVLIQDGHVHPLATYEDCHSEAELQAKIPADRAARGKWRKNPAGAGVIVDVTVPDPPHPKQALLDAIDAAKTIAELKVLMKQVAVLP
jgi:hypothetical protein